MKRASFFVVAVLGVVNLVMLLSQVRQPVFAQTPNNPWQFSVSSATHTSCTTTASTTTFCFASDGVWQSLQGATFTQVGVVQATGVTSFNGRTGAVVAQSGDYSYSQISGTPTKMTITSAPVTLQ